MNAAPMAATPGEASPDAPLIAKAAAFIAAEREMRARTDYLASLPPIEWTAADRALDAESRASVRRYHERLEEISMAEPTTPDGLAAQATVMLWHFVGEPAAWNLAESVLRVLGHARRQPTDAGGNGVWPPVGGASRPTKSPTSRCNGRVGRKR